MCSPGAPARSGRTRHGNISTLLSTVLAAVTHPERTGRFGTLFRMPFGTRLTWVGAADRVRMASAFLGLPQVRLFLLADSFLVLFGAHGGASQQLFLTWSVHTKYSLPRATCVMCNCHCYCRHRQWLAGYLNFKCLYLKPLRCLCCIFGGSESRRCKSRIK